MNSKISNTTTLKSIEASIIEELPGKELWGDIAVSEEEYLNLCERLTAVLLHENINVSYVCKTYPVSLTTFLIFLVRYKYNFNFWGLVGNELNISITNSIEAEIGTCARRTFRKYGFDFSDVEDERRVYLEPILYEAGRPPESSLDDLFYILKYDAYSVFDPQLVIEDIIAMRSYQIRKPMLRFFKRFRDDRAVEFVLDVHDAMLAVDQNMSGESHYIENYSDWIEKEKTKEVIVNRKKKEFQSKPYLSFENGRRGLCMVLPRTVLKDEWLEAVQWTITSNGNPVVTKEMNVFGDEGKRYVDTVTIAVRPAEKYHIALSDSEGLESDEIISWEIGGIENDSFIAFNSTGRLVSLSYLQNPYTIIILAGRANVTGYKNVDIRYQVYPSDREGYRIVSVESISTDASITCWTKGNSNVVSTRPQIAISFLGNTFLGLPCSTEMKLFTEIPSLSISIDEGTVPSGLQLRFGKECIDICDSFDAGVATIELKRKYKGFFSKYGIYSIKLYQYDHFLKQVEFYHVPKIKSNYSPFIVWPNKENRFKKRTYTFDRGPEWEMEFERCVVTEDEAHYTVEIPAGIGKVDGILKMISEEDNAFSCRFSFPVSPLELEVIDNNDESMLESINRVERLGLSDILENDYWIRLAFYGEFAQYTYKVVLRTANGIEQSENVALMQNSCGNFNLRVVYDTIQNCPLPAQMEIVCNELDEASIPFLVISDTVELAERPSYVPNGFITIGNSEENKDLTIKRFGRNSFEEKLLYEKSLLSKSGFRRGYPCKLDSGLYFIEADSAQSAFEFEDEAGITVSCGNNTLFISRMSKEEPIRSFSDLLDRLLKDAVLSGVNKDIRKTLAYSYVLQNKHFSDITLFEKDYENLVGIAFLVNSKCIESKKDSLRMFMRYCSQHILSEQHRIELIRFLIDIKCPQEVFDLCLQEYNLFLFEPGTDDAKVLADKLEMYSLELSLLLLLGSEPSMRDVWRDKYRDLLGKEALRSMISVPGEEDLGLVAEEQRRFIRGQAPCKVQIKLSSEISGDMKPIQEMLEITPKSINFNLAKKPDFGVYFDRIRYVDQYVNWFSINHDKGYNMNPKTREIMQMAVQKNCQSIIESMDELKKGGLLGRIAKRYDEALKYRFDGDPMANLNANNYARYFYLQGLSAFMAKLPKDYRKYGWAVRTGEAFIKYSIQVSPKICRRDLLMASLFTYLVRKEEELCR